MRYVTVQSSDGGTMTDVRPYLEWLGEHADDLPPGARAFALDSEHYDFSHRWCPRSASFDRMSTRFTDDGVEVVLVLAAWGGAPPEFVLRYRGVSHVESDGDHGGRPRSGLLVDELLPHPDGVRHELEFTGGTITVVAHDLTAGWRGNAGPESPRDPRNEGLGQLRLSTRPSDLHGLTERGTALLRQIVEAVGADDVDVDHEHDRWRAYRDAVPREDLRVLLKEAAGEGEKLSQQIVVEVLNYVDESEGHTWVDLLPQGQGRDFAERRVREWALIREVVERPREIAGDLPDLTPWCQRHLIERVTSDFVLSDLAEHGASKKIRHAAREKRAGRWKGQAR